MVMKEKEYKALISFMALWLHKSRRKAECYNDVVLVAAKILDSYDPAEYLDADQMVKKVEKVLYSIYGTGQLTLRGGE
jgi:hypothetical protein